jgi:hypothetical protein
VIERSRVEVDHVNVRPTFVMFEIGRLRSPE